MKVCPNCLHEAKDDDQFCSRCGTPLAGPSSENEAVDFTKPDSESLQPPYSMPDLPGQSESEQAIPPHPHNENERSHQSSDKIQVPPVFNKTSELHKESVSNMKTGFKEGWNNLLHPEPGQKKEQTYRLLLLLFALITIIGLCMPFTWYGFRGVQAVNFALIGSVSGALILIAKLIECGFIILNRKSAVLACDVIASAILLIKSVFTFFVGSVISSVIQYEYYGYFDSYDLMESIHLTHPASGFWVLVLAAIVSFVVAMVYVLKTGRSQTTASRPKTDLPKTPDFSKPVQAQPVQIPTKPETPKSETEPQFEKPAVPKPETVPEVIVQTSETEVVPSSTQEAFSQEEAASESEDTVKESESTESTEPEENSSDSKSEAD